VERFDLLAHLQYVYAECQGSLTPPRRGLAYYRPAPADPVTFKNSLRDSVRRKGYFPSQVFSTSLTATLLSLASVNQIESNSRILE
jgi:hypothetical protein